jgi:hypothetical protein
MDTDKGLPGYQIRQALQSLCVGSAR